ncbi:hypothetical protein ACSFCW_10265 [Yokenella regensburgei]|uniref:hypothetical protein n=1 Tax=Yokenella regensburgei TaxID=158877 RepID=UPI003EDA82D5
MKEIYSQYIGDFPNDIGGLNKFSSHSYSGFSVTSSNIGYSERFWTIDDEFIIAAITLEVPTFHTIRNIKVGDSSNDILKAYSGIKGEFSKDKISYTLGRFSLYFNLFNDKVKSIEMSLIPER